MVYNDETRNKRKIKMTDLTYRDAIYGNAIIQHLEYFEKNKMKFNIFDDLPSIQFKNRDDFNTVSDWEFTLGDVIDMNFSEMIIFFKDNETLTEWEGCILWNRIKEENLIIERTK